MGIDIYAHWRGETEAEKAEVPNFSAVHGHVGYLREAYHGGPYVTKYLVSEAFETDDGEAAIPARTLRERLPTAVLMHMYRHNKVYGGGKNPAIIEDISKLGSTLTNVFAIELPDASHDEFAAALKPESVETAKALIEAGGLPGETKSFVDFVELCERKERESGEPCTITASY